MNKRTDKKNTTRKTREKKKPHKNKRDITLSPEDAKGGSPANVSVGGEEDAGAGLESVVRKDKR